MSGSSSRPALLTRYGIVDRIGSGARATVYLARAAGPASFEKWIALKRLHPHLRAERELVRRFLDEARIAARISHPNVAQVLDVGGDRETSWIAMEYLHGETLEALMTAHPPVPRDLGVRIVAEAAEGVHAAHEARTPRGEPLDLVVRDVNPRNLFVTYDGGVKLVDLGMAKATGRLARTCPGVVTGKIAYVSPEQARGRETDRRSDVFALGVVLWELTTGCPLFRAQNDFETLANVRACRVPRPSAVVDGYPQDLEAIVLRALSPDRSARFATAQELAQALRMHLVARRVLVTADDVAAHVRRAFGARIAVKEAALRRAVPEVVELSDDDLVDVQPDWDDAPTVSQTGRTHRAPVALAAMAH